MSLYMVAMFFNIVSYDTYIYIYMESSKVAHTNEAIKQRVVNMYSGYLIYICICVPLPCLMFQMRTCR